MEERPVLKRRKKELPIENTYIEGIDPQNLPPYHIYDPVDYKDGPEGFIKWCEEKVWIPIYPEGSDIAVWCSIKNLPREKNPNTGRSYWDFWEGQKKVVRQALRMIEGRFVYKLIVLCWQRGEGKSLLACIIQLWKFMNWTKQNIVLGANSKDQVTFVHFDIIKDIINNSPELLRVVGKKNILEKRIRLLDSQGNIVSTIRAISSFSGIVSNITGYTFSEIFDMKNPRFFVQLDGSIRNIPNALGVIDSTVSSKQHILYNLFNGFVKKTTRTVFFHYRHSKVGDYREYWNPNMTQEQLDDYKAKFPFGDFERYFLNLWSAGTDKIFTVEMMNAAQCLGAHGAVGNHAQVMEIEERVRKLNDEIERDVSEGGFTQIIEDKRMEIVSLRSKLVRLETVYQLREGKVPRIASLEELNKLSDMYDTDWAIMGALDRADPMKKEESGGARTIFSCIAKGLVGSRTRLQMDSAGNVANYIYFLLSLVNVESHSMEEIKEHILQCHEEYMGMDVLCGDRWGIWDLQTWCDEQDIKFEPVFPTYDRQKVAFTELYISLKNGRFKYPSLAVWGSKEEDILKEEAVVFHHDPDKRWFGSPEKKEKGGIQDDAMFSVALGVYGGRDIKSDAFKIRSGAPWFGTMINNKAVLGAY